MAVPALQSTDELACVSPYPYPIPIPTPYLACRAQRQSGKSQAPRELEDQDLEVQHLSGLQAQFAKTHQLQTEHSRWAFSCSGFGALHLCEGGDDGFSVRLAELGPPSRAHFPKAPSRLVRLRLARPARRCSFEESESDRKGAAHPLLVQCLQMMVTACGRSAPSATPLEEEEVLAPPDGGFGFGFWTRCCPRVKDAKGVEAERGADRGRNEAERGLELLLVGRDDGEHVTALGRARQVGHVQSARPRVCAPSSRSASAPRLDAPTRSRRHADSFRSRSHRRQPVLQYEV